MNKIFHIRDGKKVLASIGGGDLPATIAHASFWGETNPTIYKDGEKIIFVEEEGFSYDDPPTFMAITETEYFARKKEQERYKHRQTRYRTPHIFRLSFKRYEREIFNRFSTEYDRRKYNGQEPTRYELENRTHSEPDMSGFRYYQ